MSTRGYVGILTKKGDVKYIYNHYDSYLDYLGITLYQNYNTEEKAKELIKKGNASAIYSTLETSRFYDESPCIEDLNHFLKDRCDIEWVYLFKDGQWFVGTIWNDKKENLIPLEEALNSPEIMRKWFTGIIKADCINKLIDKCLEAGHQK